jgi:hypothetical protein
MRIEGVEQNSRATASSRRRGRRIIEPPARAILPLRPGWPSRLDPGPGAPGALPAGWAGGSILVNPSSTIRWQRHSRVRRNMEQLLSG